MKGNSEIKQTIQNKWNRLQKQTGRLFDYDKEKFECVPSKDWYRLLWITIFLALLFAILHGYVWIMVRDIAENKGEATTSPQVITEEELSRAVILQEEREEKYEHILGLSADTR